MHRRLGRPVIVLSLAALRHGVNLGLAQAESQQDP
jgi:hypothetical protein